MALACRKIPLNFRAVIRRPFATTSRLNAELASVDGRNEDPIPKRKAQPPESPTFYSGRAVFHDYVDSLETAIRYTRETLRELQLAPLPDFALRSLPPSVSAWKSKEGLSSTIATTLSASRYRRLLVLLNQLGDFRRIAETAGHLSLAQNIDGVLQMFERADKEQHLRRGQRRPVSFDEYGRTYTVGKRKTSSARVWMISSEHATASKARSETSPVLPITEILVNNVPLNEYFKVPIDRERILRPLRLTGLLGAYNVFALTRGGGISGQAGAVAHGIAKGLAAHVPDVEIILRRAKLLRRDPRMVERKKTGKAKARKGYTWVKR